MTKKTAALLIGFGGPTQPSEVKGFIQSVLDSVSIPPARLQEVLRHYEVIGGISPFNAVTFKQKEALERYFKSRSESLPVGVAFRHSTPTFKDAFETFKKFGIEKVVGTILVTFRSFVSFEGYRQKLREGQALAKAKDMEIVYTDPFHRDASYLDAQSDRVRKLWDTLSSQDQKSAFVIYTAHSIPVAMCEKSCQENGGGCYGFQYDEVSRAVSKKLGFRNWSCAYQSRTGNPHQPWLGPDVKETVQGIDTRRFKSVLIVPLGFVTDNVEVIYDLDVEVKDLCVLRGLRYLRAPMVADHPKFIEMMGKHILEKV